jgi:hypothetical protein
VDLRIEISGDEAVCYQNGQPAFAAPLKDLAAALGAWGDSVFSPERIPDGVRFACRRGQVTVIVMEDLPQLRTVRWLVDESPTPFGRDAVYRTARLAFPFVILVVAFRAGGLSGFQQCFFRTGRLETLDDPLLLPNLYNVADGYRQRCWLCLAHIRHDLAPLSWNEKVETIRRHMWDASFNRSSDVHEGMSYWKAMRGLDPRVASLDAWEEASRRDPFFPLHVKWQAAGCTVRDVVNAMLEGTGAPRAPETLPEWVHMLGTVAKTWRTARSAS